MGQGLEPVETGEIGQFFAESVGASHLALHEFGFLLFQRLDQVLYHGDKTGLFWRGRNC